MTTPQVQNDPIYQLPFLYINGLLISNDTTTAHTVLDVAAGQCRDSNDVMDLTVGTPNLEGSTVSAPLLLNAAVNGLNGLDTGTFAEATMYAIYLVGDSRYYKPTGCIATLASNSSPLMPFGYDSYRLIGYWATQTSNAYWAVGYMSGQNGGARLFTYDVPVATAITAGTSTSFAACNLIATVPNVNNTPVQLYTVFAATVAGHVLTLQPGNAGSSSYGQIITAQVDAVNVTSVTTVLAQPTTISSVLSPTINYKVSNASDDTVAIDVAGFNMYL